MKPDLKALFDAAKDAESRAYAPYSRFRVGAAIRTAKGTVVAGCNVENAAYPVGTCAEAGAIAAMLMAGEREIAAVLVYADAPGLCTPCGGCRQRLREFALDSAKVHVAGSEGVRKSFTLSQLLPFSFGPDLLA